mmetsp:Transcript_7037/g.16081  ORF Transcript_7037/g.16081 Transcript_7037/m.16081 type:complete len:242 (-) Transcript_7037:849-1574(-)
MLGSLAVGHPAERVSEEAEAGVARARRVELEVQRPVVPASPAEKRELRRLRKLLLARARLLQDALQRLGCRRFCWGPSSTSAVAPLALSCPSSPGDPGGARHGPSRSRLVAAAATTTTTTTSLRPSLAGLPVAACRPDANQVRQVEALHAGLPGPLAPPGRHQLDPHLGRERRRQPKSLAPRRAALVFVEALEPLDALGLQACLLVFLEGDEFIVLALGLVVPAPHDLQPPAAQRVEGSLQ